MINVEKRFFEKPTVYVGGLSINVTNLDKSLQFYQEVVGFKVLEKTNGKAVLTADGKKALLTIEQPSNVELKEGRTTGLYHFAILLPSRADLSAFLKHIIQAGVQLGASDHLVSEALYFSDPDGNGIEVYRDRPASEWTWNNNQVHMVTDPLDGNGLLAESQKEWNGLPEETVMGHIHLHVSDLKTTEDFYMGGLGFDIVTTYPGALFTSTNGYHHHIGLNVWNGVGAKAPSKNSVGLNWYTLVYPDEAKRMEVVNQLQSKGYEVIKKQDKYVVEDPSKNAIHMVIK